MAPFPETALCSTKGLGSASISCGSGSRVLKTNADPDPHPDMKKLKTFNEK